MNFCPIAPRQPHFSPLRAMSSCPVPVSAKEKGGQRKLKVIMQLGCFRGSDMVAVREILMLMHPIEGMPDVCVTFGQNWITFPFRQWITTNALASLMQEIRRLLDGAAAFSHS
jgi:hypothetical protein